VIEKTQVSSINGKLKVDVTETPVFVEGVFK